MALTDTRIDVAEAARVLAYWGITIEEGAMTSGSGTANAAAIIDTGGARLFLKRRNPGYAREDWVRFDHALLAHLTDDGIPVPQVVPTDTGKTWIAEGGHIYELFTFIDGEQHRTGDPAQLQAAGETLGSIHLSTEGFKPPVEKEWGRFHDPQEAWRWLAELKEIADREGLAEERDTLAQASELAAELAERLSDAMYWSLPRTIVQADYHPANLKFHGDEVVGVFDWDWASAQPRMVDLADGLLFFCGRRDTPLIGGDIWSLTEAFDLDVGRVSRFGGGYTRMVTPIPEELAALPDLMRARWLYSRADAARRKVDEPGRLEFVTRELLRPLNAITRHEARLVDGRAFGT